MNVISILIFNIIKYINIFTKKKKKYIYIYIFIYLFIYIFINKNLLDGSLYIFHQFDVFLIV